MSPRPVKRNPRTDGRIASATQVVTNTFMDLGLPPKGALKQVPSPTTPSAPFSLKEILAPASLDSSTVCYEMTCGVMERPENEASLSPISEYTSSTSPPVDERLPIPIQRSRQDEEQT